MNIMGWRLVASSAMICGALAGSQVWAQSASGLRVEVLSSHAQLVTGGDALVRITADAAPAVTVGGRDVSSAFKSDSKGGYVGLVTGLTDGNNALVAKAGGREGSITLVNHALNGTLFAGPQQAPFVCENETHGLAEAKDASCAAPSVVKYFYRNKGGEWKAFDAAAARPTDIGTVKTTEGKDAAVIVRQEKGVINRSAYVINMLHDPAAGPLPSPAGGASGSGWNGKLAYSFGGGVQANYHMGRNLGGLTGTDGKFFMEDLGAGFLDFFIGRGYAIAGGSLNVMGTNNDDVKSAETMAKVKERFIEQYGVPTYTIGHGASGGSMQQHLIANAYPGLFDAIFPARSYPDVMSFLTPLYDCELLQKVLDTSEGKWTNDQKGFVAGKYWGYCISNGVRYPNARPDNCDASVKDFVANDPVWKAKGVRCTFQDNMVNVFGIDPKTGFARSPFDNVGVQYGLMALNDGKINFDQFLEVNSRVGGLDVNGKIIPQRMVADPIALKRAYETGRVNSGHGLAETIVIDNRSYTDGAPPAPFDALKEVDVHDGYHSAVMRARLLKANGTAANHVILTAATLGRTNTDTRTVGSALTTMNGESLTQVDKWLMAIINDKSDRTKVQKIAAHRPADLVDACYPAIGGNRLNSFNKVTDMKKCAELFPFAGDARLAAGAPATDDIYKCALKPINGADYKPGLNADQAAKLRAIFADGVCDYSKPGAEQVAPAGTWAVYKGDGAVTYLAPRR